MRGTPLLPLIVLLTINASVLPPPLLLSLLDESFLIMAPLDELPLMVLFLTDSVERSTLRIPPPSTVATLPLMVVFSTETVARVPHVPIPPPRSAALSLIVLSTIFRSAGAGLAMPPPSLAELSDTLQLAIVNFA